MDMHPSDKIFTEKAMSGLSDLIYNLCLRMRFIPDDAADATQDILLKIWNKRHQYKAQSKLSTWAYKIAVNYLIDEKRNRQQEEFRFEEFAKNFDREYPEPLPADNDTTLLEEELKIGCTHAMLQCLDTRQRLILVLSELFAVNSSTGAELTGLTPENYRQIYKRTKHKIRNFMEKNCGQINPQARCQCRRRLPVAISLGRVRKDHLVFAGKTSRTLGDYIQDMENLDEIGKLYRSSPFYSSPEELHTLIEHFYKQDKADILSQEIP